MGKEERCHAMTATGEQVMGVRGDKSWWFTIGSTQGACWTAGRSSSHRLIRVFTVTQSFFLHFYLLGVVWTTTLLMGIWYFAYKVAPLSSESLSYVAASVFLSLLMEIHVLRRLYETFHVFNYSSSARMHIFGYLTGIYFYTAAPLSLCTFYSLEASNFAADQVAEFKVEGQEKLSITDFDLWGYVKPITRLGWCQWAGAAIFAWGWLLSCDSCMCFRLFKQNDACFVTCAHPDAYFLVLVQGSLRERGDQTAKYVIPHGDWFEIVSSPHYLAEMVANLAFAAAKTRRWCLPKFEDYLRGDETAPFFGFLGAAAALVFSCMGAAYGTAKSGVGVASMGVMRPELVMKSIVPVVMAGVLGIYGLIIAVIISTGINPKAKSYYLFDGYAHLSSGLACGLAGLSAGMAIGIVGDAGVRANAQQPKLFVGMILILIFAEALALYGLIVGIILSSRAGQSRAE
ncbi:hypothetical protein V6N11_040325 [Hibiscus sabdariffa]|uniref:V-type proton ATPase proteolipid subunit n=1 Tax=Hibiscus sabdariffa TaxID=183260 RepID=A0ABR2RHS3_9ROSI